MLKDLPTHEQFLSSHVIDGGNLSLRVTSDFHPGSPAMAYVVTASGVSNPPAMQSFLDEANDRGAYLYLSACDGGLLLETEDGDDFTLVANSIAGHVEELNVAEMRNALDRSWGLYLAADERCRALGERLNLARDILREQARRVEAKASNHETESVAGILYSQQLHLIERLLNATET